METEEAIQERIAAAESEAHRLRAAAADGEGLSPGEQARLSELEVELDQLWDQVRRFRAGTPDAEELRPRREVEGYLQ